MQCVQANAGKVSFNTVAQSRINELRRVEAAFAFAVHFAPTCDRSNVHLGKLIQAQLTKLRCWCLNKGSVGKLMAAGSRDKPHSSTCARASWITCDYQVTALRTHPHIQTELTPLTQTGGFACVCEKAAADIMALNYAPLNGRYCPVAPADGPLCKSSNEETPSPVQFANMHMLMHKANNYATESKRSLWLLRWNKLACAINGNISDWGFVNRRRLFVFY